MPSQYLDYPAQARRLADAGDSLLEAIEDSSVDRGIVLVELEAAATIPAGDLRARFEPADKVPAAPVASPEDVLSRYLLEFQSANALMSAGLAMNEHGGGSDPSCLTEVVSQIRATSSDVASHIESSSKEQFAPPEQTISEP